MVHLMSTCAIVDPILNPFKKVARMPIQQVENMKDPPRSVTPQAPAMVYMMQRSQTFQSARYIKKMKNMLSTLSKALHAMIFHSLQKHEHSH